MSLRAIAWALEEAPVDCTSCVLVLAGIANHVDEDLVAWPSVPTLAAYGRCSDRTVQRHLRELEHDAQLIREVSTPKLQKIPVDKRPKAYQITPPRGVNLSPRPPERGDTVTERGDNLSLTGCHSVTQTKYLTSQEPARARGDSPLRGPGGQDLSDGRAYVEVGT